MSIDIEEDELEVWIRPQAETKPSEYPELNEELGVELTKEVDDLVFHIYMLDNEIDKYREALRLLQPHGTGRVDIRYWKTKIVGKHPIPFYWKGMPLGWKKPLKKGQKHSKNVSLSGRHPRKRFYNAVPVATGAKLTMVAKKTGKFRETREEVKEVLLSLEKLLAMRKTVLENQRRFRISNTKAIAAHNAIMRRMDAEIAQKMPGWRAFAESKYTELAERKRDHIVLLDQEDKRLAKKGFQFGTMPTREPS